MTKLNKSQIEAVESSSGPLLIVAGAGTGKTTVIIEKIKYIISNNLAKPEEILALTFTEKAAQEMQERIDMALPLGYAQMDIDTFHGFCDKVLRQFSIHIGIDPNYKLLSEARAIALFRKYLYEFDLDYFRPLGNPNKFISGLLTHFSRLSDEDITPDQYLSWVKSQDLKSNKAKDVLASLSMTKELASTYKKWDEIKLKNSYFEFSDLISKTIFLFVTRPNILKQFNDKYKYILIDEFQDTNYSQNKLAIFLSGSKKNITVVGDDDQSIYRFRGAAVSNILSFRKTFPEAKTVVLNENYRSFQEILDASYNLILNNNPDRLEVKENINKKLISKRKGKGEIKFLQFKNENEESQEVVNKIIKLSKKYKLNQIAILVRANNHAQNFIKELKSKNIPFQFLGPEKLYTQNEIIDLICYLKVLYDITDSLSLTRILSMKEIDFSGEKINNFLNKSKKQNKNLFDVVYKEYVNLDDINPSITSLFKLIKDHQERMHRESSGILLYEFLREMGIVKSLLKDNSEDSERKAKNISKFFEKIKDFEIENGSAFVREFVDWLDISIELGESPKASDMDWQENEAVNILTVHSSKGLEFDVVFVANLVSQRFPSMNRSEQIPIAEELIKESLPNGDYHLQEERRLFYVALTRAKDKVFLSASDYYGDAKRSKKISQFVYETLGEIEGVTQHAVGNTILVENIKPRFVLPATSYMLPVRSLSYSAINTFQICPLHFKFEYILKLPKKETATLNLGNILHLTLKKFYENKKRDKKVLLKLLDENWIDSNYQSKKHENLMKKRAAIYLEKFYESRFDSKIKPLILEKKFKFKLPIIDNETPLFVTGVIDRLDKLNESYEIIDYKTGEKVPSQKEVDDNMQLTIYALAAKYAFRELDIDLKKLKLTLYYFEEDAWITTTRSERDIKNAIKEIYEIRKNIQNSNFKCSKHYFCQTGCEYELFCKSDIDDA